MTSTIRASLLALTAALAVAGGAAARPSAAQPLAVSQDPVLGHLIVPGDRVEIDYSLGSKIASPAGSLFVRSDLTQRFERLPLEVRPQRGGPGLRAVVPARLLGGHRLFFYAVVRDTQSGRSVRVPAGSPRSAWVLQKPVVVRLGTHRFGRTQKPEAVVARVSADQVGWDISQEFHLGPQTFLVGPDRSIWLHDSFNNRLLVLKAGSPAHPAPLPPSAGMGEPAFGPAGSIYVSRPGGPWGPPQLYRLSPGGAVLWQSSLPAELNGPPPAGELPLRRGPDGTLYMLVNWSTFNRPPTGDGWMPVATPAGRPLSVPAQRAGILWGSHPLAGLRRLVAEPYVPPRVDKAPVQWRYAIVDRAGRVVRAWQVLSKTELSGSFFTPQLVGGDPVVNLTFGRPGVFENLVLRLSPTGTAARLSIAKATYGDTFYTDLRVGPDGKLYQLASSPRTGIAINRYSLGR